MNWSQVKAAFAADAAVKLREVTTDAEYRNVAVLSELESAPSDKTVYFCRQSALEALLPLLQDGQYTLILYADDAAQSAETLPDTVGNLAVLSSSGAYAAAYAALQAQMEAARLFEDRFRALVSLSRRSPPLSTIVRQISLLYNDAPVFILNDTLTLLASSVTDARFTGLQEDAARGYISPSLLAQMQTVPEKRAAADGQMKIMKHPHAFFKCYDTAILANSIAIGYLSVFVEAEKRLNDIEVSYLPIIANLLSHRMQQSDDYLINEYNRSSRLFSAILGGTDLDDKRLRERMRSFGCNLRERMRLVAVRPTDADLTNRELLSYGRSIRDVFPNGIFVVQEQYILYLISYPPEDALTHDPVGEWSSRLDKRTVRIGVSSAFSNLREAPMRQEEALAALELGAVFYPDSCVYLYDGLRVHRAVRDLALKENQAARYLYPPVKELLNYDLAHSTQLLKTLYLYLRSPKNPQAVCAALHIHKNTLYQRLRRIQSFLQGELSLGMQTQIYFSLLLLKWEGRLYFDMEPESDAETEDGK